MSTGKNPRPFQDIEFSKITYGKIVSGNLIKCVLKPGGDALVHPDKVTYFDRKKSDIRHPARYSIIRQQLPLLANSFGLVRLINTSDQTVHFLVQNSFSPCQTTVLDPSSGLDDKMWCARDAIAMTRTTTDTATPYEEVHTSSLLCLEELRGLQVLCLQGYGKLYRRELRHGEELACPLIRLVAVSGSVDFGTFLNDFCSKKYTCWLSKV